MVRVVETTTHGSLVLASGSGLKAARSSQELWWEAEARVQLKHEHGWF